MKKELSISDDAELTDVMKEVTRLAHTPKYHDKEVGYIVWDNREALSKLVSPKRSSFEQGGQSGEASEEKPAQFGPKMTPEQAGKAMQGQRSGSGLEIRKAKK